jgi:hypothetical protein
MSLFVVDRFHTLRRQQEQTAIDAGQLRKLDALALLEGEALRSLAMLSLVLFIVGTVFFVGLNLLAFRWQYHVWLAPFSVWSVVFWIIINVIGYIVILPIHELIHGICFILWGGKPHFGARLPLAIYCGAREQLFRRNHYLVVGLAPLIVLTLLGIVVTLLQPGIASYLLLAFIGNFSGAAGDIMVAQRIAHLPSNILLEDTETGYTAWGVDAVG